MFIKLTTLLLTIVYAAIATAQSPSTIYAERVMPLLKSGGNSCSACHFQGLDFKSLFTDDPAQTFIELRSLGWVDTQQPAKSKILEFIARHTEAETQLQRSVRTAEHAAIQAWIVAACNSPALLDQPVAQHRDLALDAKLIRHARADQIEMRFVAAVWSQLERCANCHSPDRNQKQVEKNGELMSWIVPNEPLRTLELLTDRELINLDNPDASPLRTKPAGIEKHGAGIKFPVDGETDSAWTAFLRDYAKTILGDYATSKDLPIAEGKHRWRSGLHLRVSEIPEAWFGKIVAVYLYALDKEGNTEDQPLAFGESFISQERAAWSNSLELLGKHQQSTLSELTQPILMEDAMPPGKYELRIGPVQSKEVFKVRLEAPWQPGHSTALKLSVENMQQVPGH